jgi:cell division protein FtsB
MFQRKMLDYTERRQLRKIVYAKPTIIILALITLFVARGAWSMYGKYTEATEKRDKTLAELNKLETREADLAHDIARLSSDRGVEAEIRGRYMVAKEGEKVMIIADAPELPSQEGTSLNNDPTLWQKFLAAVGFTGE